MSGAAGPEAVDVLRAFMSEMKQWELRYHPLVSENMSLHAALVHGPDCGRFSPFPR